MTSHGLFPCDPLMVHVTREQIQEIDRLAIEDYNIPVETLMENAGLAVADEAMRMAPAGAEVAVVCGRGNNGGDGFVAARALQQNGRRATLVLVGAPDGYAEEAFAKAPHLWRNLKLADDAKCAKVFFDGSEAQAGEVKKVLASAALILDSVLGTGLQREVRGAPRAAVDLMNEANKPILAVDIPSGLDANDGVPLGAAVKAQVTVTMGLPKIGFKKPGAPAYLGRLLVASIGFPTELVGY